MTLWRTKKSSMPLQSMQTASCCLGRQIGVHCEQPTLLPSRSFKMRPKQSLSRVRWVNEGIPAYIGLIWSSGLWQPATVHQHSASATSKVTRVVGGACRCWTCSTAARMSLGKRRVTIRRVNCCPGASYPSISGSSSCSPHLPHSMHVPSAHDPTMMWLYTLSDETPPANCPSRVYLPHAPVDAICVQSEPA